MLIVYRIGLLACTQVYYAFNYVHFDLIIIYYCWKIYDKKHLGTLKLVFSQERGITANVQLLAGVVAIALFLLKYSYIVQ